MMDKREDEFNSVFEHWCERNKKHPSYEEIKTTVRDRGISIRKIAALDQDWDDDSDEE